MNWQSIVLILVLVFCANGNSIFSSMNDHSQGAPGPEKTSAKGADIQCTITTTDVKWHTRDKRSLIAIKIESQGVMSVSVMPSLRLFALPKREGIYEDEYWAPFGITPGTNTHDWQRLDIPPDQQPASIHLIPAQLLWISTKSSASIWPIQPFARVVPQGKYSLQVQLEINGRKSVLSNEIKISVIK